MIFQIYIIEAQREKQQYKKRKNVVNLKLKELNLLKNAKNK